MRAVVPKRGELWWCEVPETGLRPVVVLSRDETIPRRRQAIIAPCTRTIRGLASEVYLDPEEDPVPHASAVNLDSVENVSIGLFISLMGSLSMARMGEICAALEVAVDCDRA